MSKTVQQQSQKYLLSTRKLDALKAGEILKRVNHLYDQGFKVTKKRIDWILLQETLRA